ncbi:MAG: replicative DNA helicase [Gemmiger sp.]
MPRNEELSLSSLGIQMPYNMQAEQSVLGAALMDETVLNRLITDMEPEMFYSDQNRAVYETMRSLYTESEAVDLITLVNALGNNGTFAGADDAKVYVTHLAETVPAISNVDSYLKIVREKYQARRLIEAARSILSETSSGEDADMLLESAEQKIYDIRSGRDKSGVKTIRESILEVIDTMQKLSGADRDKFAGIPTGFNYLDTVLTGLGRSDLIILAARPGMGKTSFALNIATNVARQQKVPTIIFSLEMTCEQLTDRILSSTANIDSQAFRTGRLNNSDWNDFRLRRFCITFPFTWMSSGISVPEIKAKIRTINQDPKKEKIGLVIIDYLQLMQSAKRTESRVQEISDITRNLKIMAKELNVPVIALSQLSRAAEKTTGRSDHRPQLSDLRDSGSIEQDADVVLFLYRAAYYNSQNGEDSQANENEAECIVAKNRHGETSVVRLGWDGAHTRFSNLDVSHEY